jgi:hypothetical protein
MGLGDARRRARTEFDAALLETGRSLDEIRDYIDTRPEMKRPFYRFPRRPGVAGIAANFVLHAGERMRAGR